ncbi:hypothetical protein K2173_004621 [Erythroxylum novogranatense]|uniref:Kinesin motor domain-containing protein n=1 Tax=Erythroxylum novogranatense TaxID=1862640 RepID=A0AAV8UBC0_9ROSI|nr:hypothetical protein K2173_004621 [Erythroxylum novogranatense]
MFIEPCNQSATLQLSAPYMADSTSPCNPDCDDLTCKEDPYSEEIIVPKFSDPFLDDRSMLGYSFTSPDLVLCAGSPDIVANSHAGSQLLCPNNCSVELSLDNGIDGSPEIQETRKSPSVKFATICQTFSKSLSPESSFELLPPSEKLCKEDSHPVIDINPQPTDFTKSDPQEGTQFLWTSQMKECKPTTDNGECQGGGDYEKLLREYECQGRKLAEVKKAMEELRSENLSKNKECQEAMRSLKALQNELMRKSMHVGSLAYAIEGQVKEKSKWFSSLRDLTRKLKIMKMDHVKLLEDTLAYKKCVADMPGIMATIESTMKQQQNLHEDLKTQFIEGAQERRELYNKVLELKGNIRVFCRCRPLNAEEVVAGASVVIDFDSAKDGELTVLSNGFLRRTFKFDAVFSPQSDQADVFQDTAPFATSVLDGYNVCIFAYGQTGTGKTFTMEGTEEARGVNFRTLDQIFRLIEEKENLFQFDLRVSVLEVYNEQIRDLLASGSQSGVSGKRLEIRHAGEGFHHVPGLVEARVNNMNEVWEVLQTGSEARAVGPTNANERSSRSHCIHCVTVKGKNLLNGECTKSKLWLVDLAGSERVAKTEVQGDRLKETQNINKSLSALGDVISALANKSPHIPFRNSKLTHLLQDSLGGDSKTLMFVQISPNENDLGETLCSLNFASRVRGIELGPAKRQLENSEMLKYKQLAEKSKQDLKNKDLQIKKMEETIHGLELKLKEKDFKNRSFLEKLKELESQLLIERKLARQHVDTKIAQQLQQNQQMKEHKDEQNNAQLRLPFSNRLLGNTKNGNELMVSLLSKEHTNFSQQQLMEKNTLKPPDIDGTLIYIDHPEKENNPLTAELPERTGRASICATVKRVPITPAPRRNSLIPLATVPNSLRSTPVCPAHIKEDTESENECKLEEVLCNSPKGVEKGTKKLGTILRRSLQKKTQIKPSMQHLRKGGISVGVEKVRVSIGSRGRMAHRILLGSKRVASKDTRQMHNQKEKERGWNIGTIGKATT